jgi:hypothetical protein
MMVSLPVPFMCGPVVEGGVLQQEYARLCCFGGIQRSVCTGPVERLRQATRNGGLSSHILECLSLRIKAPGGSDPHPLEKLMFQA